MDIAETPLIENKEKGECKKYELKLLEEIYSLKIQTNPKEKKIIFDLVQKEKLSSLKYNREFDIKMIKTEMESLSLNIKEKKNVSEIFDILDEIFMNNNVYLKKSEEKMVLILKIEKVEKEEKNIYEYNFYLFSKINEDSELIKILLEEVIILKKNNKKKEKIITELIEEKENIKKENEKNIKLKK